MIAFRCASCQKQLSVNDPLAGKQVRCPGCGKVVAVPHSATAALASQLKPASGNLQEERTLPPGAPAGAEACTLPPRNPAQAGKESLSDDERQTALGAGRQGEATRSLPGDGPSRELYDFLAPAQQADEIGRLGPYRVLKVLGAGGMGVVFQAEDPKLKRKVALKAMLPALAASETARQRFLREAQTAAAIEHDHIVPIFQVGEDRGVPYIAMPFLKGEPLDERLKRDKALPVAEVLRIGREAARGLAAAHAAGLVHRDIKPANLWLEDTGEPGASATAGELGASATGGRVKILDFGLARAATDNAQLTQQGAIIGTPAYMAPEQAAGKAVDGRCDLFSLGCVLYRMATGQLPFKGADTISTLVAVATEEPRPLAELRPDLPGALSGLVMQLLAKKPEERPESARAVAEALRDIEGQTAERTIRPAPKSRKGKGGGTTRTEAARTQPVRPARKRLPLPWLVGGGLLGLGVLVAAIVLFWQTPHGAVRIESDDPNVEVVFDKTGPTIKGADREPITLRAGEHGVLVRRGDFTFETDRILVEKGKTITLKVELLPGKMQVVQDGKVIGARDVPLPKTFTNRLGMKLVLVPAGKFLMGSPQTEEGHSGDKHQHEVEITKPFYLGQYLVTKGEFAAFVKETGHPNPGTGQTDQHPVANVDWKDAVAFCDWLSKKEGKGYRLPTEAEWEYSCRAGTTTAYSFGDDLGKLTAYGWSQDNAGGAAHKVGEKKPNPWGLYDMHGNVWEWCQDWYDKDYYKNSPRQDPQGPSAGAYRVSRGGSFGSAPGVCRAAFRNISAPSNRHGRIGFRVVCVRYGKVIGARDVPLPKTFTNRLGMKLVLVPAGKFLMGSPQNEEGRQGDEQQHEVQITAAFYLGQYVVTKGEFAAFVKETGHPNPGKGQTDQHPVANVDWNDAKAFCSWLSKKEGKAYRLPTEAEWEYSCRAGTTTAYSFGDDPSKLTAYGWYGNAGGVAHKVGDKKPNPWGLYDVHGNVNEWCADWYDKDYYRNSPHQDPQGPSAGTYRVIRGGSFDTAPRNCRAAARFYLAPSSRPGFLGFRVVCVR